MRFQITIRGKLAQSQGLLKVVKNIWGDRRYFSDEISVDIGAITGEELGTLKAYLERYSGDGKSSVPSILRDIAHYEALVAANTSIDILQKKPRNLEQLVPMLTKLAILLPRQLLWAREDDTGGEQGVWLPYLIVRVEYNPGTRDSGPYVTLRLKYIEHGEIKSENTAWYWYEVAGQTMQTILANEGWYPANPAMEADYEYDMEMYEDYVKEVGRQFMATGWAFTGGIDDDLEYDDRRSRRKGSYRLGTGSQLTRVVRDVNNEQDKKPPRGSLFVEDIREWADDEDEGVEEDAVERQRPIPPVHPYIVCHDMYRHRRVAIHARNMTPYVYNTNLADQLVLPEGHRTLIDLLTKTDTKAFHDVVANKAGGVVIICQGLPGTGKTLTSEVISEQQQRPLYSVQCSQLGMDVDTIESNLKLVLSRASRWNAVTLLDEADVYLMARGHSLEHNAIVGVFLRVLEYAAGTLFLTTNRLDAIDDAIVSRSVAVLRYGIPPVEDRVRIWHNLLLANGVGDSVSGAAVLALAQIPMTGRDIKNSLKLCLLMGREVTCENIQFLLQYRPVTADTHGNQGAENDPATKEN